MRDEYETFCDNLILDRRSRIATMHEEIALLSSSPFGAFDPFRAEAIASNLVGETYLETITEEQHARKALLMQAIREYVEP